MNISKLNNEKTWIKLSLFFSLVIKTKRIIEGSDFMSTYNTKEISELLNVSEETVRRWIRSGKLKAEKSSKKQGNIVYEKDLFEFVSDKSKYKRMIQAEVHQSNNPFSLNDLLNDLIIQRNQLDEYIVKIQALLKES